MELIPILSTIILVATISTFLLAIGAYILYKVREAKGQRAASQGPSEVNAEIVTPAQVAAAQEVRYVQPVFGEQAAGPAVYPSQQRQPAFAQQGVRQSSQPRYARQSDGSFWQGTQAATYYEPQQPSQYSQGSTAKQPRGYAGPNYAGQGKEGKRDTKFLKYTSEGYVSAKEDKESGALKWR